MAYFIELVATFVDSVAVLMALVLMLSVMHRGGRGRLRDKGKMGVLFSAAIVFSMVDPIMLPHDAGTVDMRALLVGTAAGLLGPIVGVIAFATACVFCVITGDPAMLAGFLGVSIAYGAGLGWHYFVKDLPIVTWKKSVVLGLMLFMQIFAIFLFPAALWANLIMNLAPFMFFSSILGSLVINHLLLGELSFLSEAETCKIEANTDHLTGLLNRRGLDLLYPGLIQTLNRSNGQALLYFDIDRFKLTNDTYGHAIGDDVLRHVVDQVAVNLRQNDTFVRLGGDEFVVVLPDIDAEKAKIIGERCRCVVNNTDFEVNYHVIPVSISVGVVWASSPTKIETLLGYADKALYQAKEKGRNSVVFISERLGTVSSAA